jgi:hypothetical protein
MFWRKKKPKTFRLAADQIRPIAEGHGGCLASDMITVDGRKVGFAYREASDFDEDSGWRFTSGLESQKYTDDPSNWNVYDVNTIANYDPEIIPLLDAPEGSAFEREKGTGRFIQAQDWQPPE